MAKKKQKPKEIHYTLLAEKAQILLPTEREAIGFSIASMEMDDRFVWTLNTKFFSYFTTLETVYNMVVFRNPDSFNRSIKSLIDKALNPQTTLADLDDDKALGELKALKRINIVAEINKVLQSWNDAIDLLGVENVRAELESYKRKASTKDLSFMISSASVDYFKNKYVRGESYVACLEIFGKPREDNPSLVDPILYHPDQFKKELLKEEDFLL